MKNELGNLAGIDYSMNCPAITVYDTKLKKHFYHFFYNKPKHTGHKGHNIYGVLAPEYSSPEERYDNLSEWAICVLKKHNVSIAGIESISFGSKGLIVNLGENIGVLKNKIWSNGIDIKHFSPQTVKKVARSILPEDQQRDHEGKLHNMDKKRMVEHFFKETHIPLWDVFGLGEDKNPLQDIADSYFILKCLEQSL